MILYAVGAMASIVGIWSKRTILDTDRFTAVVVSVADTPEVSGALSSAIVDQVVLVAAERRVVADRIPDDLEPFVPLLVAAVRPAVEDQVAEMLRSDLALQALDTAVSRAHRGVIDVLRSDDPLTLGPLRTDGEAVVLDLSALIVRSIDTLVDRGVLPERLALGLTPGSTSAAALRQALSARGIDVPDTFGTVVVFESDTIATAGTYVSTARRALAVFERSVVVLVVTTMLLAGGSLLVSEHRWRTSAYLSLATITVGVATVLVARRALRAIPTLVEDPEARRAAASIAANVATGLVRLSELLILLGSAALLVGWLSGPGRAGTALRRRIDELGGIGPTLASNPDAVRVAGVAAILGLFLWWDWSILTVVAAAAIGLVVIVVPLVASTGEAPSTDDPFDIEPLGAER